jgi:hypothetical protein
VYFYFIRPVLEYACPVWGGGWIGVYKSVDPPKFEAKSAIRQWSCLNLNPLNALLWSHSPGSELNCKLNPQSEPKY